MGCQSYALGSGKVDAEGGGCVAGASVGAEVPGISVGVGSAGVAEAGTGVEGGGVSCPLLQAVIERSKNRMRIRLIC